MAYLDLRDLAEELQKLRDRRTTEREHMKDEHGVDMDTVELQPDGQGDVPTWEDYHTACHEDAQPEHNHDDVEHWVEWLDEDDIERLKVLEDLDGELNNDLEGWARNEPTAIPEDEFEEYAEELAKDIGAIDPDASGSGWPLTCIDWEKAADELKVDYTTFAFDGTDYLVRSY